MAGQLPNLYRYLSKIKRAGGRPQAPGPAAKKSTPVTKLKRSEIEKIRKIVGLNNPALNAQMQAQYGPRAVEVGRGGQFNYPNTFNSRTPTIGLEGALAAGAELAAKTVPANDINKRALVQRIVFEKALQEYTLKLQDHERYQGAKHPGVAPVAPRLGDSRTAEQMILDRTGITPDLPFAEVLARLDDINPGNYGDNYQIQGVLGKIAENHMTSRVKGDSIEQRAAGDSWDDFNVWDRAVQPDQRTIRDSVLAGQGRRTPQLLRGKIPGVDNNYYGQAVGEDPRVSPTLGTLMQRTFGILPVDWIPDDVRSANKLGNQTADGMELSFLMKLLAGGGMGPEPKVLHLDNTLSREGLQADLAADVRKRVKQRFGDGGDLSHLAKYFVDQGYNKLGLQGRLMKVHPARAMATAYAANDLMNAKMVARDGGVHVRDNVLNQLDGLRDSAATEDARRVVSKLQDQFAADPRRYHTGLPSRTVKVGVPLVQDGLGAVERGLLKFKGPTDPVNKDRITLRAKPPTQQVQRRFEEKLLASSVDRTRDPGDIPNDPGDSKYIKKSPVVNQERTALDGGEVVPKQALANAKAAGNFLYGGKVPVGAFLPLKNRVKGAAREAGSKIGARALSGETNEANRFNKNKDPKGLDAYEVQPHVLLDLEGQLKKAQKDLASNPKDATLANRVQRLTEDFNSRATFLRNATGKKNLNLSQWFTQWKNEQMGPMGARHLKREIKPGEAQLHDYRKAEDPKLYPDRESTAPAIQRVVEREIGEITNSPEDRESRRLIGGRLMGQSRDRRAAFVNKKLRETANPEDRKRYFYENLPEAKAKSDTVKAFQDPESYLRRKLFADPKGPLKLRVLGGKNDPNYQKGKTPDGKFTKFYKRPLTTRELDVPKSKPEAPEGKPYEAAKGPGPGQVDKPRKVGNREDQIVRKFNPFQRALTMRSKETPLIKKPKNPYLRLIPVRP